MTYPAPRVPEIDLDGALSFVLRRAPVPPESDQTAAQPDTNSARSFLQRGDFGRVIVQLRDGITEIVMDEAVQAALFL